MDKGEGIIYALGQFFTEGGALLNENRNAKKVIGIIKMELIGMLVCTSLMD